VIDAIDHYWLGNHSCDGSSIDEEYAGGHGERFEQGLKAAEASGDFDFSAYDANKDGILQEDELVIVVATPQSSNGGSAFDTNIRPYCDDEEPVVLNGVILRGFISWYTGNGAIQGDAVTLSHELGHFPVGLDDMYTSSTANTPVVSDHDPARKSIMSVSDSSSWQHLDGWQKLSLGWVTPRIVRENGVYPLEDVKTGREVLILPREGSLGREYFVVENRQEEVVGDDGYDQTIGDSGIAVWLVVEPTYTGVGSCLSDTPDANDCAPMRAGLCSYPPPSFMYSDTSQNYIRRVLRLIRPFVAVPNLGMGDLWNDSHGALADAAPVCPPLANPLGSLRWSDGSASGYGIAPLPAPANVMNLPIFVP